MSSQAASATSPTSFSETLLELTEQLLRAGTAQSVLEAVLRAGLHALGAVGGVAFVPGPGGGRLEVAALQGHGSHPQASAAPALPRNTRQATAAEDALQRGELLYFAGGSAQPSGAGAALPLVLDGEALGALTFDVLRPLPFTAQETRFLRGLAGQGALALGRVRLNAELEARVQARTAELEARTQASEEQRAALDAFVTYKEAVGSERDVLILAAQAAKTVRASLAHVSAAYYQLEDGWWKARAWSEDVSDEVVAQMRAGVPQDAPSFAEALRTHSAVFVDGWDAESNGLPGASAYGAAAFVPLLIGGEPRGLFTVGTPRTHTWTERERAIVRAVARGLGLTLERTEQARQLAQERSTLAARTQALEAFAELTRDLSLSADPYALIERAEVTVLSLLPPGYAAFWELRGGLWRATRLTGDVGSAELQAVINAGLPAGQTPTLDIPQRTRAPFYQDVYPHGADTPAQAVRHVNAVATLPVLVSGQVRGLLNVPLFGLRRWSEADRAVLETVVRSLGLALERAAAQQALDRTQHHLKVVAENAPILLFATDAQGVFTLAEGRLLENFGMRPGQAVGQSATALLARDPDLSGEGQRLRRALAGEVAHDLTHLVSSGVSLETWYIPVKDALGEVSEVVGVSLDVTERLETQRRIERANEDLRRSNAELEQFAYVVSHDLQEPLRTVTSFSQLLTGRYSGQLDARANLYVRMIREGNERMGQLLQDLLVFSRVSSAAQPLVEVDTGVLLAQVVQDLHAQIERTGAQVHVDALPAVQGDASQLRQVFQNLIGNALKFSAAGRPARIQVTATPDGTYVRFRVSDNGIGIEPEFFERIFTIFQRLHTRDQYEGNGIGLSLVRKIVERHGGKVWLDSTPGQGTAFSLTLPAGKQGEQARSGL